MPSGKRASVSTTQGAHYSTSDFATAVNLPAELLGKVFASIADAERCRVVPLVCQRFLEVLREYPPRPTSWTVNSDRISFNIVSRFTSIGGSLEDLTVYIGEMYQHQPTFLPQLLALAAVCAPNLRHLRLHCLDNSCELFLPSVALLTQITRLEMDRWEFARRDCLAVFSSLSSLRCLKEVDFSYVDVYSATRQQAFMLWNAMACLTSLTRLQFTSVSGIDRYHFSRSFILQSLPLVQQIRDLHLQITGPCLVDGHGLPATFSTLTKVSALVMKGGLPIRAFDPILDLPLLESLDISLAKDARERMLPNPASISLTSQHLTSLRITGGSFAMASALLSLLPPSTPSLVSLRVLALEFMKLQNFPFSVASTLVVLTELSLDGNHFYSPPTAVAQIPTLRHLSLRSNGNLQLIQSDLDTLTALSALSCLDLGKVQDLYSIESEKCWSKMSRATLFTLGQLIPKLNVRL